MDAVVRGALGGIRTPNLPGLNRPPLPIGLRGQSDWDGFAREAPGLGLRFDCGRESVGSGAERHSLLPSSAIAPKRAYALVCYSVLAAPHAKARYRSILAALVLTPIPVPRERFELSRPVDTTL